MAIGQLLDYARYIDPSPTKYILLPSEPPPDMTTLVNELDIGIIHAHEGGFVAVPESRDGDSVRR